MTIPSFSLEGKVALVTGGRRGIGRAIALAFAEAGADVAVCDLVIEDGELGAVADEIQRLGYRSLAVQTDVTQKSQVDSLVKKVVAELGVIDILVNNVGMVIAAPVFETSEDNWDEIFNTNLKSYYLCSQAVFKGMVERKKGGIINIASTAAFRASTLLGAYSISKAGVVMLTRVLAQSLHNHNIRVNAIAPAVVKTEFTRGIFWEDPESSKEPMRPTDQMIEPGDVVGAALFLASDASNHITGHTIVVGGSDIG